MVERGWVMRIDHRCVALMRFVCVFMVVLPSVFTLFIYLQEIPVYPPKTSVDTVKTADTTRELADAALVRPSPPVEFNARDSPRDRPESKDASLLTAVALAANNDVAGKDAPPAPTAVAPTAAGNIAETISRGEVASSPLLKDAEFYRERGIVSYRSGDLPAALADFDLAIRRDPNFEGAYIDRGITLYRMHEFDRAFADVAQAIRIENSYQTATPPLPRPSPLLSKK